MNGVLLRANDDVICRQAERAKLPVVIGSDYELPFDKTLIVEPKTRVPWDLLPAAWQFLERWDAAVPFWTYGKMAKDIGQDIERKLARQEIRDLRVLLYSYELLFVRKNSTGETLIKKWESLQKSFENLDKRLTFLRAVYAVKPRLCVLPITWLADVQRSSQQAMLRHRGVSNPGKGRRLVVVELEPGRIIKCYEGDEERVRRQYQDTRERAHR